MSGCLSKTDFTSSLIDSNTNKKLKGNFESIKEQVEKLNRNGPFPST
jgi:hypothetical protein